MRGGIDLDRAARRSVPAAAVLALASLFALSGCTSPRADRIAEARAALASAEQAGAPLYAPDVFEDASGLLARAEESWRRGHHRQARDLAGESTRLSRRAVRDADANRSRARSEAVASLRRLEEAVDAARDAVANMARGATLPELAQARGDLDRLEQMLVNVRRAIEHGLYLDARQMSKAAENEAASIEEGARLAVLLGGGADTSSS
jgi:hypothetical protein